MNIIAIEEDRDERVNVAGFVVKDSVLEAGESHIKFIKGVRKGPGRDFQAIGAVGYAPQSRWDFQGRGHRHLSFRGLSPEPLTIACPV